MPYRVQIHENADYFVRNRVAILVAEELGDGRVAVEVPEQDGEATVYRRVGLVHGEKMPSAAAIMLPMPALAPLRDAIDERLGRRYDVALVDELRAALELERRRYDDVVARLSDAALDPAPATPAPWTPDSERPRPPELDAGIAERVVRHDHGDRTDRVVFPWRSIVEVLLERLRARLGADGELCHDDGETFSVALELEPLRRATAAPVVTSRLSDAGAPTHVVVSIESSDKLAPRRPGC